MSTSLEILEAPVSSSLTEKASDEWVPPGLPLETACPAWARAYARARGGGPSDEWYDPRPLRYVFADGSRWSFEGVRAVDARYGPTTLYVGPPEHPQGPWQEPVIERFLGVFPWPWSAPDRFDRSSPSPGIPADPSAPTTQAHAPPDGCGGRALFCDRSCRHWTGLVPQLREHAPAVFESIVAASCEGALVGFFPTAVMIQLDPEHVQLSLRHLLASAGFQLYQPNHWWLNTQFKPLDDLFREAFDGSYPYIARRTTP